MQLLHIQHGSDLYTQAKQLRAAVLRLPLRMILSQEDVAGEENQLHFVALEHQLVIGTVTMKLLSKTEAKLRQMAISPALQGKGIGQKLVAYAEAALKKAGFTSVETNARATAEKFYARMGYVTEGAPFIERTLPHVKMVKKL